MKYPIGIDNFAKLRNAQAVWVDKSLLIRDIIDDGAEIILIPRPRRFGKTLNLSMIQHFFAKEVNGLPTADLFKDSQIAQVENADYLKQYQGQYPVIFITFKGMKANNYSDAYTNLVKLIRLLYLSHDYLLDKMAPRYAKEFNRYLQNDISSTDLQSSLQFLTQCLQQYYGKPALLLIDEYDAPLQAAHLNDGEDEGYRKQMTSLMRGMLGEALKGNDALYKGVLTGILRIAKENIFSDLNNLSVYTIFNARYATAFGFTEKEVRSLITQSGLSVSLDDIRSWYNGYNFSDNTLYNPWSILNCLANDGKLVPYWVNTSSNDLIRTTVQNAPLRNKWLIEQLIRGETIQRSIKDHLTFDDLHHRSDLGSWSLLLMSGYLTYTTNEVADNRYLCQLKLPNREVIGFFKDVLLSWLLGNRDSAGGDTFIQHLLEGNIERFERQLHEMLARVISYHDVSDRTQESFYQGLMIGCLLLLNPERYTYDSNRESGKGRYDLAIFPKDPKKDAGAIFELKTLKKTSITGLDIVRKLKLKHLAKEALQQIEKKDYIAKFEQLGVSTVRKVGLAFCGKDMVIARNIEEDA